MAADVKQVFESPNRKIYKVTLDGTSFTQKSGLTEIQSIVFTERRKHSGGSVYVSGTTIVGEGLDENDVVFVDVFGLGG